MSSDKEHLALLTGDSKVTILVGPNEEEFKLPKYLICRYSSFFTEAFEGDFKEGFEGVCRLPEDDPRLFTLIAIWFYETQFDATYPHEHVDWDVMGNIFRTKLQLYYLADKLGINLLLEQIATSLVHYNDDLNKPLDPGYITEYDILPRGMQEICDKTSRHSPLRCMVLRRIARFLFTSDKRGDEELARRTFGFRDGIYRKYIDEVPGLAAELVDEILHDHSPSKALSFPRVPK